MDAKKVLVELKALHEKATEGDWIVVPQSDGSAMIAHEFDTGRQMSPRGLRLVCHVWARGSSAEQDRANRDLIAAMRNALPALLAAAEEVASLRERAERLSYQHANQRTTLENYEAALRRAGMDPCDFSKAIDKLAAQRDAAAEELEREKADTWRLIHLIQRAADAANTARMRVDDTEYVVGVLRMIGGLYDAALSPVPSSHNPAPNVSGDGGSDSKVSGLMLPDLWTVVDGGGTRVGGVHDRECNAVHQLQMIEGTPGSIHGPYRVVKIPGHMAAIEAKADGGGA